MTRLSTKVLDLTSMDSGPEHRSRGLGPSAADLDGGAIPSLSAKVLSMNTEISSSASRDMSMGVGDLGLSTKVARAASMDMGWSI